MGTGGLGVVVSLPQCPTARNVSGCLMWLLLSLLLLLPLVEWPHFSLTVLPPNPFICFCLLYFSLLPPKPIYSPTLLGLLERALWNECLGMYCANTVPLFVQNFLRLKEAIGFNWLLQGYPSAVIASVLSSLFSWIRINLIHRINSWRWLYYHKSYRLSVTLIKIKNSHHRNREKILESWTAEVILSKKRTVLEVLQCHKSMSLQYTTKWQSQNQHSASTETDRQINWMEQTTWLQIHTATITQLLIKVPKICIGKQIVLATLDFHT